MGVVLAGLGKLVTGLVGVGAVLGAAFVLCSQAWADQFKFKSKPRSKDTE